MFNLPASTPSLERDILDAAVRAQVEHVYVPFADVCMRCGRSRSAIIQGRLRCSSEDEY